MKWIIVCIFVGFVAAQDNFVSVPLTKQHHPIFSSLVSFFGNATISNGLHTLNITFLVDTGSPITLLPRNLVDHMELKYDPQIALAMNGAGTLNSTDTHAMSSVNIDFGSGLSAPINVLLMPDNTKPVLGMQVMSEVFHAHIDTRNTALVFERFVNASACHILNRALDIDAWMTHMRSRFAVAPAATARPVAVDPLIVKRQILAERVNMYSYNCELKMNADACSTLRELDSCLNKERDDPCIAQLAERFILNVGYVQIVATDAIIRSIKKHECLAGNNECCFFLRIYRLCEGGDARACYAAKYVAGLVEESPYKQHFLHPDQVPCELHHELLSESFHVPDKYLR